MMLFLVSATICKCLLIPHNEIPFSGLSPLSNHVYFFKGQIDRIPTNVLNEKMRREFWDTLQLFFI